MAPSAALPIRRLRGLLMWTLEEVWTIVGELYLLVKTQQKTIVALTAQIAALTPKEPHDPQ